MFAVAATLYFWWQNTKGIHESSEKALWIMQLTTVMVIALVSCVAIRFGRKEDAYPPRRSLETSSSTNIPLAGCTEVTSRPDHRDRCVRCLGPFGPGNERRRIACTSVSRN